MRGASSTPLRFVTALCLLVCAVLGKDYYQLLGLQRGASAQQIKKAYRALALQFHPDKVTGTAEEKEEAANTFSSIRHAYEVLSNDEKRNIYDRYGEDGIKQFEEQGSGAGGGSMEDMISRMFGGMGGMFGGPQEEEEQEIIGAHVRAPLEVSLRDLYVGRTLTFSRVKGSYETTSGTRQCRCRMKQFMKQLGPGMYQQVQRQECDECANVKLVEDVVELEVEVDPGMAHGQTITLREEGEPHPDGDPGDLELVLVQRPHEHFRRDGLNLKINVEIKLVDALTGFSFNMKHLDGHEVKLEETGITIPGKVKTIRGEGMPKLGHPQVRGDLLVTYKVEFPRSLTDKQKETLRQLLSNS